MTRDPWYEPGRRSHVTARQSATPGGSSRPLRGLPPRAVSSRASLGSPGGRCASRPIFAGASPRFSAVPGRCSGAYRRCFSAISGCTTGGSCRFAEVSRRAVWTTCPASWSRRPMVWCLAQSGAALERSVAPPSAQCTRWWASHQAAGASQCGKVQCRSRRQRARIGPGVNSRTVRPWSSISPRLPRTTGMMPASQAIRRTVAGLMSSPAARLPSTVAAPGTWDSVGLCGGRLGSRSGVRAVRRTPRHARGGRCHHGKH